VILPFIRQQGDGDCGVAALAMFAALPYEHVYAVVLRYVDTVYGGRSSLNNADIVFAAHKLGIRLQPTRTFDPDEDEGILRVRWSGRRARRSPGGHMVALRRGLIFCPTDAVAMDWRDYLGAYKGRACTLLRAVA
jgi:hypothetical protein